MTERPPLSRALRDSTKLLHTDAERAGAMGALLHGRIDRGTYVLMLSSLHAIYRSLEDAQDAIVTEAADGFRRHIALFEGLAAQASAAPPPAAATPISMGYLARVDFHGETDLPGASAIEGSIIIGTRASKLALWQSGYVRDRLLALHPNLDISLERISTRGDEIQDRPLAAIGRNSLFVAEIEDALRSGRIRLAVHSAKDLPSTLADDMTIVAYTERADPRDAFVSRAGKFADLPAGARIGTSSPRRACQLKAARPDIECLDIRGNVDTRLAKLERGDFDAIVLAAAGLERLGWLHVVTEFFEPELMLPAVSQGILAIEGRSDDLEVRELCATLDHAPSRACAEAERAFLAAMGAGCNAPLAGFATYDAGELALTALVGAPDGRTVRVSGRGSAGNAAALGRTVASDLVSGDGAALLEEAIAAQAAAASDA